MKGLDILLSRCYHIREISRDPECILRLAVNPARAPLALADGTIIRRGDLVGDLHLCSPRVPAMPPEGPDLAWGLAFSRRMKRSLELLAELCSEEASSGEARSEEAFPKEASPKEALPGPPGGERSPGPGWDLAGVLAFRAVGSLMSGTRSGGPSSLHAAVPALAGRLGLEIAEVDDPSSAGFWRRFAAFWENGFNLALVWAYNAPSLRSRQLGRLRRVTLWISRRGLATRYGRKPSIPPAAGNG